MRLEKMLACFATVAVACSSAQAANPEWDQATRLYNAGDYKGGLTAFRKIADKMPSDPSTHYMLAQCYKNLGNTKQAILELDWITKYSNDARVKGAATALLGQLKPAAARPLYATIPNAVSPYSLIEKERVANNAAAAKTRAANAELASMPSKAFIGDSASQTVSAAAQKGWMPCRGPGCLNFGRPGWHHEKVEGFPDTNNWATFDKAEGGTQLFSQLHIGDIIKDCKDVGPCPQCKGTGWVRSK